MAKSLEELLGVIQTFPESFRDRFGRKVKKSEIIVALNLKINSAQTKQLGTLFDNYEPSALKAAIGLLQNESWDSIDDDLETKVETKVDVIEENDKPNKWF